LHAAFRVLREECGDLIERAIRSGLELRLAGIEQHVIERQHDAALRLRGLEIFELRRETLGFGLGLRHLSLRIQCFIAGLFRLRLRVARLCEGLVRFTFPRGKQDLLAFDFARLDARNRRLLLRALLRDVRVLGR
jgi:hypothetical protein